MTEYLTDDQISYVVHGYSKRTYSHSIFLIKLIMNDHFGYRDNMILRLRFKNEMTYKQIAEVINTSNERPRQIIFNIYRTMRRLYPRYKRKYLLSK